MMTPGPSRVAARSAAVSPVAMSWVLSPVEAVELTLPVELEEAVFFLGGVLGTALGLPGPRRVPAVGVPAEAVGMDVGVVAIGVDVGVAVLARAAAAVAVGLEPAVATGVFFEGVGVGIAVGVCEGSSVVLAVGEAEMVPVDVGLGVDGFWSCAAEAGGASPPSKTVSPGVYPRSR